MNWKYYSFVKSKLVKVMLKTLFSRVFLAIGMVACSDAQEEPSALSDINLDEITWVESKSPIEIKLYNTKGELVTESSQLEPNREYRLEVNSDVEIGFKIRKKDGFSVVNNENGFLPISENPGFTIITDKDMGKQLYLSMVPLFKSNNAMVKEMPRLFLFPSQGEN